MAPYTLPDSSIWFITGCSSGIGHALATYLLQHTTSRVIATARNPSTLSTLPQSPNLLTLPLDVTSDSSASAAISTAMEKFSRIDVLVNNAGYNVLAPAETIPLSTAQNIMDTNFWGAVRLTRLALPIMRNQQSGVILQISSTGGRRGFAGNAAYHASKFALEGWTEAVSKEVEEDWNIRFCCAEPGGVKTNYAARSIDPEQQQAAKKEESEAEKAYSNPKSQINMLKAMHENPDVLKNWAEAEKVVEVMYEVIASGDVPLRFPLGIDSWGIQKAGLVSDLQALEKFKEVATSVANNAEEQLKALEGLRV